MQADTPYRCLTRSLYGRQAVAGHDVGVVETAGGHERTGCLGVPAAIVGGLLLVAFSAAPGTAVLSPLATQVSPADSAAPSEPRMARPKVILETDFTLDVDDVGALAVLHALADLGEVEFLAVSYNEVQRSAAAAIRAVNAWYGRDDLPVGVFQGPLEDPDDEHSRYIDPLARMAPGDAAVDSSLNVYRRALRAQADGTVTIVSVPSGFTWDMQPGWRTYLRLRVAKRELAALIEALMVAEPALR